MARTSEKRALAQFALSLWIEFGPVAAFFLTYMVSGDFFSAVKTLLLITILSLAASLVRDHRIPLFSVCASVFVLLTGGLTLWTHDPYWVVLEYTVYNVGFACLIWTGLLFDFLILKSLFKTMFLISDKGWHLISMRWGIFFLITGLGNEYVYRTMTEETWIEYRFLAALGLAIFGFLQMFVARRERLPGSSPWGLQTEFRRK